MTRRSWPLAHVIAVICLWNVITQKHGGFLWCDWSTPTTCGLASHPQNSLCDDEIRWDISCSNPGEPFFCFSCWGLGGSCQRERPVNQPVPQAADKVIRLRVTSMSLHQQITIHLACLGALINSESYVWYSSLYWLCLSLKTVHTVVHTPRTFTRFHRVISYLNMWITALNENPWL